MDQSRIARPVATSGWMLFNSQQSPAGTYEYFNPDAKTSEARFYMECSNKGICDRATGLCACFDSYEGSACHRTTCPSKRSGHGTCESIRELGAKAGGTLFGIEHPAGAVSYDLWDANSTYGCRCDPWFRGPDCAKRTCKVGVDPLFLAAGTPRYETFVIHAFTSAGTWPVAPATAPWIRLRVFDYYGESYLTSKIPILDDSHTTPATALANEIANAAAVEKALKAIPNQTFRDVNCDYVGVTGNEFSNFNSLRSSVVGTPTPGKGMSVICQYNDNPGKHRIPEVESFVIDTAADSYAYVVTAGVQGENDEWFTKQTTVIATPWAGGETAFTALGVTDPTGIFTASGTPRLLKIGADIVLATAWTTSVATLIFPLTKTIGSNTQCSWQRWSPQWQRSQAPTPKCISRSGQRRAQFHCAANFSTGDLLFFRNQFFYVQQIYPDSVTPTTLFHAKLDKPFGGKSLNGGPSTAGDVPYKVDLPVDKTKIFNYVSECSGRVLCSTDTGVCTCFKGYTNDNCNTQNILAL